MSSMGSGPNSLDGADSSLETSFESDDATSPEPRERTIQILSTPDLHLPEFYTVQDGETFGQLANRLADNSHCKIVALEPTFGPYPFYQRADPEKVIEATTHTTFMMPPDQKYLLVVVRTHDQDMILPFICPEHSGQSSMMDILGPIVQNVEMTIQCIKDYRNGHDVGQKSFSHHLAELGVDFPTVALVDTTDGRFKFRDKLASGVPLPLKALFLRARKLVRSASTGKINRLQHIHLSRAILHLIVCAGDIMETKFTKEDLAYVLELEAILESVSESIFKSTPFPLLCGNYHGAIEIRRSYETYRRLQQVDDEPQREELSSSTSHPMPEARDDCAVGDRNIPSTSGPTSSQRNISPLSTPETRPAEISNSSQFDATPKWPNHQLVLEPSITPQKVRDNLSERAGLGMDVIILKETTLESSFQSSHFLERIAHLILELTVDGRVVGKANLLSRKHTPGTWDADQILILREKEKKFTLSVFVDLGAEDRQLLGVMELFGQNLFDKLGERPEIPLMSDIDMVLKTSVEARSSSTLNHGVPQFKTMSLIIFQEITLELSAQSDHPLHGNLHLILELKVNNQVVDRAKLLPRGSNSGLWETDQNLVGRGIDMDFTVSIFTEAGGEERQVVGSVVINGADHNNLEKRLEICPHLFLNMKVVVMTMKDAYKLALSSGDEDDQEREEASSGQQFIDADNDIRDYESHGNLESLNQGISRLQLAAKTSSEDIKYRLDILNSLGVSLLLRFERLGDIDDLNNAIAQLESAVELPSDSQADKADCSSNLGNALQRRFERLEDPSDLDNAIVRQQVAVDLTPNDHPNMPGWLSNLGNSLILRFGRQGNLVDIDNAIALLEEAASCIPDGHPDQGGLLNNLGNAFQRRFERLGKPSDIHSAIRRLQAAVDRTPNGQPNKHRRLNNLGNALLARFEYFDKIADINNAIIQLEAAAALLPDDHADKLGLLNNLGNAYQCRFEYREDPSDLDEAISRQEEALKITLPNHPERPSLLSNLGGSLRDRFKLRRNRKDIDDAITHLKAAVSLVPEHYPVKISMINNLGLSFLSRFLWYDHPQDAESAISQLSAAAKSSVGSPAYRLEAAESWIRAASVANHSSLLDAYECALTVVPLVAWLGLSIIDRHQHLARIGEITQSAVAAAISLECYDKAVEWLEQGRSIVWTQILQLRTPVDRLRGVDPKLADEFFRLSLLLDSGIQDIEPQNPGEVLSQDGKERRYRALAEEWEQIIEKIRALPDFQDFLRPFRLSRLLGAAKNGPVVVLNIAAKRCDALALVNGLDEVVHIPLPNFSLKKATELQTDLRALLKESSLRQRAIKLPGPEGGADEQCKRILAELWEPLVKPVLDSLAFSAHPDTFPRIWWCVTGPLAFLPLHAAGIYDGDSTDDHIHDYVISSYTPALSTLLESSKATSAAPFRMLSVIEPSTGKWWIPNTEVELEHIQRRLVNRHHLVLKGPDATKERVIKAMVDHNWIHLACHGSQNARNPTKSALKLRGDDLPLEDIIKLNLPTAEFAFLSACQTVTGDETLSDEAVHIAGGMLLAGYRSVVATMWSIEDKLAPEVADEFYRHLTEDGGRPDNRKAAEALHLSVQKLRNKLGISMVSWIPFVHFGI